MEETKSSRSSSFDEEDIKNAINNSLIETKLRTSSDEDMKKAIENSIEMMESKETTTCLMCTFKNNINNTNCKKCGTELVFNKWRKYIKETLDDGNCFYSAIYHVLKDKNKLDHVGNILGLNIKNEKDFIISLRKLISEYGQDFVNACYDLLSSYKIEKSYTTKSDYLTIKRWVIDAVIEKGKFKPKTIKLNTDNKLNAELEEYKKRQSELGQSL